MQFTDTRGWKIIDSIGNEVYAGNLISDIQVFSSSGTWTKPDSATFVEVDCVGGGGGGGGGEMRAAATAKAGGGGGGSGIRSRRMFLAQELPLSVVATVGLGGRGGLGATVAGNGSNGLVGNNSYFGNPSASLFVIAYGGGGSATGTTGSGGGSGGGTGPPTRGSVARQRSAAAPRVRSAGAHAEGFQRDHGRRLRPRHPSRHR